MTEELSHRELALLKLIDIQAREITQLGMEVDTLRHNKRFTNTKYMKEALEASPTFTKAEGTIKPPPYVQEETKLKRSRKK